MKKIFTLAAAVLASFSLAWADQTDLVSGVTLPDMPSASLDLTSQTTFTPDGNGWVVFDPYADAANLSTVPAWWNHSAKTTQSENVTADAVKDMTAPFVAKTTNNFKVNFNGNYAGAIRFTGATDASFLVNSRSSKVFYVGLYTYIGETQTLVEEKSVSGSGYKEILYSSLNASTTYVAYVYGKVSQNQCIAEIALKGPAPVAVCPSGLSISGTKAYTEGEKIELTAALGEGNGNISYQWYKGSIAEGNKIEGATTTKFEISNCAGSDAGDYFCVASKAACEDAASAAYAVTVKTIEPTGDATITYTLTKGSDVVSGVATGVNSISGLSTKFAKSTLTFNGNGKDNYAARCESMPAEFSEEAYYDLQFALADGYVFTPSAVSVKVNPFSSTGNMKVKVAILDAEAKVVSNELACSKETDNPVVFADGAFTGKIFEGTIHIRIYLYGASGKNCYLKSPITIAGTVAVAPTKYNVTFDANGGDGEMASLKYVEGAEVTLPACTFTAPTGKEFDSWTSEDVEIANNKFTMPAKNVTVTATWKTEVIRYTVTYKHGDKTLGSEDVEANGSPANYATYQVLDDGGLSTFVAWYNDADLAEEHKVADIAAAVITEATTFYAKFDYKYSESINIEKWVMENGISKGKEDKTTELIKFMGTMKYAKSFAWESGNLELDSLDNSKSDKLRNYAYLGLKVKKSGSQFRVRLAPNSTVKIKFGAYKTGSEPTVSINGGEKAPITIENNVYSYTATGEDLLTFNMKTADAVVLQQIAINEELADPALFAINCAAVENGTLAAAYKLGIPGETIALTVTPAGGYVVASVSVNSDPIAADGEGKYSFEMPAAVANVAAVFSVSTALGNTEAEVKAVKVVENGMLIIKKDGKKYNIIGSVIR